MTLRKNFSTESFEKFKQKFDFSKRKRTVSEW